MSHNLRAVHLKPSLLFRWRPEARDEERAVFVPVRPPFAFLTLPAPPRRLTCDQGPMGGTIEVELIAGHRLLAEVGADPAMCASFSRCCWIDDPRSLGLTCDWLPATRT